MEIGKKVEKNRKREIIKISGTCPSVFEARGELPLNHHEAKKIAVLSNFVLSFFLESR